MQRRNFFSQLSAGAAGVGLAACGGSNAEITPQRPTFVLIHGAWHGAWCWARVVSLLAQQGYRAIALDLPGHGVGAQFPASYRLKPQDTAALAVEVSPLAALSLNDYRDSVLTELRGLVPQTGPVILVGHSLGGATLTAVAEAAPELVRRLVYLTAFAPVSLPTVLDYINAPSFSTSLVPALFFGNPAVVACGRINHDSASATYAAADKQAFYGDVTDANFQGTANMLTPDEPIGAFVTPVVPSVAKWGSLPRTYIRCLQDQAIPLVAQDQMIAQADAFTPSNKFVQVTLNTSHSAFASNPKALVDALISTVA